MTPDQLRDLVNQRLWSKQVVVWIGERSRLDQLLQGKSQQLLDVLELIPEDDQWPSDPDERAECLRSRLDEAVQGLRPAGPERVILRVRNAALLATLGTGLRPFFDWFAGSSTMTVLEVEPIKPIGIPDTMTGVVRVDFDWLPNLFRDWLSRPEHLCTEA
jgi:hypothetical protein